MLLNNYVYCARLKLCLSLYDHRQHAKYLCPSYECGNRLREVKHYLSKAVQRGSGGVGMWVCRQELKTLLGGSTCPGGD